MTAPCKGTSSPVVAVIMRAAGSAGPLMVFFDIRMRLLVDVGAADFGVGRLAAGVAAAGEGNSNLGILLAALLADDGCRS